MSKSLYAGNLSFETTAEDLREAFGRFGVVTRAQVVTDGESGRSRGYGLVEMSDGADQAVANLHGTLLRGRSMTVNEASPKGGRRHRRDRS